MPLNPNTHAGPRKQIKRSWNRIDAQKCLVLLSHIAWIATFLIATTHPLDRPVDESMSLSFAACYGWVAAQSFLPIVAMCALGMLLSLGWPRLGFWVGATLVGLVPVLLVCDCITFHWIGERLLSPAMYHIVATMLPNLLPFLSVGTVLTGIFAIGLTAILAWCTCWLTFRIAKHWKADRDKAISPSVLLAITTGIAMLFAIPAIRRLPSTLAEMRPHSTRHPLCFLGMVKHLGVGVPLPTGSDAVQGRLHGLGLNEAATKHLEQLGELRLANAKASSTDFNNHPDVLIIVVESLQLDILSQEVMPNLFDFAGRGLHLRNHFSGGNGTNLGFFSLITGKEATWFPRSEQVPVLMNKLFRQAGYKTALFSGIDDFPKFDMDTYINPNEYDIYQAEPCDWLASDQLAVDRTIEFFDRNDATDPEQPRLAVLHTYSTHSPFDNQPEDEHFLPASSQYYVTPYTQNGRTPVWNRYRNAVRSADRLISSVLSEDRVTVVVGDHGEALLEDGTIGHGTRLDSIQNQTPAILFAPGIEPNEVKLPTCHIDILPTVLSACGLTLNSPELLDGVDLLNAPHELLATRSFASCHFMGPELMLVGPWTNESAHPFAYRCAFSIKQWQATALNPIDRLGLDLQASKLSTATDNLKMQERFGRWMEKRFGLNPMQDRRNQNELFRNYLNHSSSDIRLQAVEIASNVASPDRELIELVSLAATDHDAQVREAAQAAWVTLQRRAVHNDETPNDAKPASPKPPIADRYASPRKVEMRRKSSRSTEEIQANGRDVPRFIAHAGGAIDGHTYTNSLEALNHNYRQGFRTFELDIVETIDHHFVAAHDWASWKNLTNYSGSLPPTLAQFRQHKILDRYTPMDMDAINHWFAGHPKAILVTDKIDKPTSFANQFIDSRRLVMELFSIEAVEEATDAKIAVTVSEPLLNQVKTNKVNWLLDRNIDQVDLSRLSLDQHMPLIHSLNEAGIKVFVYHVNYTDGEDEAFVVCHDFDFVYGMYADQWGFGESQVHFECCPATNSVD